MLASEVLAEAAVQLNDPSQVTFTNAKLLPLLKKAWGELEVKLQRSGIQMLKEVSAVLVVPANTLILNTLGTFPTDFISPVELKERPNSNSGWKPMTETAWEPTQSQETILQYWAYREDQIKLLGATAQNEVLLRYMKSLSPISTEASNITKTTAKPYLAARTAELAARYLGSNPTRADQLKNEAGDLLNDFMGVETGKAQSIPARRRPYWRRRRY